MEKDFENNIGKKEERRLKAKAKKGMGTFAWIGMLGIIGWSITVPLLLGIALGKWLETVFPGKYSFTLMFMFAGLVIGCVNAWKWVSKAGGAKKPKAQSPSENEKKDTRG